MAEEQCAKFGKGFDADDWECEACELAAKCKAAIKGKGKAKAPAAKSVAKKTSKLAALAADAKKDVKKDVKTTKKTPAKKAAAKPTTKAAPKKVQAKKKAPEKKVNKGGKALKVVSETKAMTKKIKVECKEIAERIIKFRDKAAEANHNLIFKAGPLMEKVRLMLSPDRFADWCDNELGYSRKVVLRFIQAWKEFGDQPKLLEGIGQLKMNPILSHPDPKDFLKKNLKKVQNSTGREVRELVMVDRAKRAGEKGGKGGSDDPILLMVKILKGQTSQMDKNFLPFKKLASRKSVVLDAPAQETLTLYLKNLDQYREIIKDLLSKAKKAPAKKAPAKKARAKKK